MNTITRKMVFLLGIVTLALVSVFVPSTTPASASGYKLTHAEATARLRNAGITWSSSGNCSDRYNRTCTSFEQINSGTIDGIINYKYASGCAINITGGTETGHSTTGTYTHWNGYKLDISRTSCVTNDIQTYFTYLGTRGDGAPQYRDDYSANGDIYADEYWANHWDILYY